MSRGERTHSLGAASNDYRVRPALPSWDKDLSNQGGSKPNLLSLYISHARIECSLD